MKLTTHSAFSTSLTLAANHAYEHISLLTFEHQKSPVVNHLLPIKQVHNRTLKANQNEGTFYNTNESQQRKLLH